VNTGLRISIAGAALLVAVPAGAYVLSGHTILRRFAEAQATLHASASALVGTAHIHNGREDWPVRLDLTKGGGCRAQVGTPQGDAIMSRTNGRLSSQGASFPALEAFVELACPVLAMRDVPVDEADTTISQFAGALGVDMNVSALSLVDDRVGYIVGARPRQPQRPQLWFDKETDRPLRIIAQHSGQLWDIRLLDSDSIATNRLGPRIVNVWQGSERQLELRLMAANPRLSGHELPSAEIEEEDE
jgi:hypothetical protein